MNLTPNDPDPLIYCLGWDVNLWTGFLIFKANLLKCRFDILSKKKRRFKRSFYSNIYCNAQHLISIALRSVVLLDNQIHTIQDYSIFGNLLFLFR